MEDRRRVWIDLPGDQGINELISWLEHDGATDVTKSDMRNIDPAAMSTIVSALVLVSGMASVLSWLRRQRRCLLIIDARGGTVKVVVDCRERQGRTVIVANDGTAVEIVDPTDLIDLNRLAVVAAEQGVKAVSIIAKESGATVQVP